ncbi:hypothetical protein [Paenibacillus naphthalenovorans]|uniref:hypothetical protein n=1 Tax=Paenibacillus naphthalenovorans TaxID=162209 RepID=UPI0008815063|nr:hypothetical protein [Paenibacillus naphthalenovorans]SDI49516.1 hypothetical protein SAMN05421868_10735 [Paenibacillus naphthalenovorans]
MNTNMDMKTIMSRQIRGYIMKVLQIGHPQPTGSNVIEICLVDAGLPVTPTALSGHLDYLKEKGYIEITKPGLKGIDLPISLPKLTPKGIDLLEGNIDPDPGVYLQ